MRAYIFYSRVVMFYKTNKRASEFCDTSGDILRLPFSKMGSYKFSKMGSSKIKFFTFWRKFLVKKSQLHLMA